MSTLQEISTRYIGNIICYGSFNALVNAGIASGTRFIGQIPTQASAPAAIAGLIHTITCATSIEFTNKFLFHRIENYFLKSSNPNQQEMREAYDKALTIVIIMQFAVATLATVIATPIVTKGLVSHQGAFAFALINNFSTTAFTKFFFAK